MGGPSIVALRPVVYGAVAGGGAGRGLHPGRSGGDSETHVAAVRGDLQGGGDRDHRHAGRRLPDGTNHGAMNPVACRLREVAARLAPIKQHS